MNRHTSMMNDAHKNLAWLLAAEEHPHLREETEFLQAEKELNSSPELQAKFAESKEFLAAHPVLTSIEGMPVECRVRIEQALREAKSAGPAGDNMILGPWGIRRQFAWAAVLVLLLAGMSVLSSYIIEKERFETRLAIAETLPPLEAFYQYAGSLTERPLPLQHRENSGMQLVSWLEGKGAPPFKTPDTLLQKDAMGCAYLDGPDGKVSVICFTTDQGAVHLFVACADTLNLKGAPFAPKRAKINQREALKWVDEENAYLLITHDKDQKLPEMFL